MNSSPPTPEQPRDERRRAVTLRTIGMILFGAALLLLVMGLTILRNEPADPHGLLGSDAPSSASPASGPAPTASAGTTNPAATTQVSGPRLSEYQQAKAAGGFLTGSAAVDQLQIYDGLPPASKLLLSFPKKGTNQISSTFLIIGEAEDSQGMNWYHIRLPIRPNGSTGWVRAADLTTATTLHEIRIDLSEHRLSLYERGRLKESYPIGVGKGDTPTPPGEYYITVKLTPANPNTVYGVLAMGVSGFSEKLTDWPEDGQFAIHGTNDPSSIGKDVSHGCIRLQNADILALSQFVVRGTPVEIQD